MKTPIRALLIASAVVAVGLASVSSAANVINVPSSEDAEVKNATVNTSSGKVSYDGQTYGWTQENSDVLNLSGDGVITINAQNTGAGNGILNATGGTIKFSAGKSTAYSTLRLIEGSVIAKEVNLQMTSNYNKLVVDGGVLNINSSPVIDPVTGAEIGVDTFALNSRLVLDSGTLNSFYDGSLNLDANGGTFNVLEGSLKFTNTLSIAKEVVFNTAIGTAINVDAATIYIDADDTLYGDLTLTSGKIFVSDNDLSNIIYKQKGGNLNLTNSAIAFKKRETIDPETGDYVLAENGL